MCNNISQYYCFYCIFHQMQPWWAYEIFKIIIKKTKQKKNLTTNFRMVAYEQSIT